MAKDKIDSFLDDDDALDAFLDAPSDSPSGQDQTSPDMREIAISLAKQIFGNNPASGLTKSVMSGKMPTREDLSPSKTLISEAAKEGAPGLLANYGGEPLREDAPAIAKAVQSQTTPTALASTAASMATGGMAIPVKVGMQALMTGSAAALEESLRQASGSEDDTVKVLRNGLTTGAVMGMIERALGGKAGAAVVKGIGPVAPAGNVLKANAVEKVAGGIISATTRVPERFAVVAVADPSVLSPQTPSVKQVGAEMGALFKKLGTKINSEQLKIISGNDYFPSENQVAKLQNTIINPVLEKIQSGAKVSDSELVFAERAANAIKRSTAAQINKSLMSWASGAQSVLLDRFDSAGLAELPKLKAKYFKALAKEAFDDFLPRNKMGNPNALSTLVMLKKVKDGVEQIANSEPIKAAGSAVQAAAFSPFVMGLLIRASRMTPKAAVKAAAPAKFFAGGALSERQRNGQ